MGKGGGKCASRDQSASSSRTPRLPASRLHKAPVEVSTSASKPSSKKEKAIGSDLTTLVPLIPKEEQKEVISASHAELDADDGIDTNVTFDEDMDYSASESQRRLTRVSSSEMPSVYNTANVSPARSFSSGGRSPETVYLSGSEDLPSYKASPARPVGMPLPPKYLKAGLSSPEPVSAAQCLVYNPNNDDDLFLAKGAPAASPSSSAGPSSGGLRKRHSIAASSSTTPFEARSLTTSSSFPATGGRTEEKPLPRNVGRTIDEATPHAQIESREEVGHSIAAVPVDIKDDPKSSSPERAEASSKETLGDNWEMVSPVNQQSKGLGPEWVSVPKPNVADTSLEVASVQGSTEVAGSQLVGERVLVEPTDQSSVEPLELSSKALPVTPIAESSTQSRKASETYDEEAETVKSVGSDQSDEIETRSINGDGGDYILLGKTESPALAEGTERGSPQSINMIPLPRELQEEYKRDEQPSGWSPEPSIVPEEVAPVPTPTLEPEGASIEEKSDHLEEHAAAVEEQPIAELKDLIAPAAELQEIESLGQHSRIEDTPVTEVQATEPQAEAEDEIPIVQNRELEVPLEVSKPVPKASAVPEESQVLSISVPDTPIVPLDPVSTAKVLDAEKDTEDSNKAEVVPQGSPQPETPIVLEKDVELSLPEQEVAEDVPTPVEDAKSGTGVEGGDLPAAEDAARGYEEGTPASGVDKEEAGAVPAVEAEELPGAEEERAGAPAPDVESKEVQLPTSEEESAAALVPKEEVGSLAGGEAEELPTPEVEKEAAPAPDVESKDLHAPTFEVEGTGTLGGDEQGVSGDGFEGGDLLAGEDAASAIEKEAPAAPIDEEEAGPVSGVEAEELPTPEVEREAGPAPDVEAKELQVPTFEEEGSPAVVADEQAVSGEGIEGGDLPAGEDAAGGIEEVAPAAPIDDEEAGPASAVETEDLLTPEVEREAAPAPDVETKEVQLPTLEEEGAPGVAPEEEAGSGTVVEGGDLPAAEDAGRGYKEGTPASRVDEEEAGAVPAVAAEELPGAEEERAGAPAPDVESKEVQLPTSEEESAAALVPEEEVGSLAGGEAEELPTPEVEKEAAPAPDVESKDLHGPTFEEEGTRALGGDEQGVSGDGIEGGDLLAGEDAASAIEKEGPAAPFDEEEAGPVSGVEAEELPTLDVGMEVASFRDVESMELYLPSFDEEGTLYAGLDVEERNLGGPVVDVGLGSAAVSESGSPPIVAGGKGISVPLADEGPGLVCTAEEGAGPSLAFDEREVPVPFVAGDAVGVLVADEWLASPSTFDEEVGFVHCDPPPSEESLFSDVGTPKVGNSAVNVVQGESDEVPSVVGEKIRHTESAGAKQSVESSWRDFIEEMENEVVPPAQAAPIA